MLMEATIVVKEEKMAESNRCLNDQAPFFVVVMAFPDSLAVIPPAVVLLVACHVFARLTFSLLCR